MDQWLPGAGGGGTFGGAGDPSLDNAGGYTGVHNCQNTSDPALNMGVSECKLSLNKVGLKKVHSLPFSTNENMLD